MKEEDIRKTDVLNKYLELSAKDVETFFTDSSAFYYIDCPACGSKETVFSFKKNDFDYHQCPKCETLFVNPRPPIEQLNNFYSDSPSTRFWVNEFFKPVAEVRREKIFRPRAQSVADFLKHPKQLIIGDIGAGFGLFLEEFRNICPDNNLIAIEPSNEMSQICTDKGLKVLEKMTEDIIGYDNYFDVLMSFELFEHLNDPKIFIEKIYSLLKPDGYLILTTLNGLGFDIQTLWEKSKSISPPHHLNFFNSVSIEILLKSLNFEIVEISTPGVLDWNITEQMYKNENCDIGRFLATLSKHGSEKTKDEFQKWISNNNFSSHMRIIAKKK